MDIKRNGSRPSGKGSSEWFTGTVRIDPLFEAPEPAHGRGASVTFEPPARTAWHTHPLGQTLIVIAGVERVQRWGGPIEEIRPRDVVWFPPTEKHWHDAAPTTAMTHMALGGFLFEYKIESMQIASNAATPAISIGPASLGDCDFLLRGDCRASLDPSYNAREHARAWVSKCRRPALL